MIYKEFHEYTWILNFMYIVNTVEQQRMYTFIFGTLHRYIEILHYLKVQDYGLDVFIYSIDAAPMWSV